MSNINLSEQPYAIDGIYYKPDVNIITLELNELSFKPYIKKKRNSEKNTEKNNEKKNNIKMNNKRQKK